MNDLDYTPLECGAHVTDLVSGYAGIVVKREETLQHGWRYWVESGAVSDERLVSEELHGRWVPDYAARRDVLRVNMRRPEKPGRYVHRAQPKLVKALRAFAKNITRRQAPGELAFVMTGSKEVIHITHIGTALSEIYEALGWQEQG